MKTDPYILFNKSIEQCRRLGARGGRRYGLNCRVRRLALTPRLSRRLQKSNPNWKPLPKPSLLSKPSSPGCAAPRSVLLESPPAPAHDGRAG